MNWLLSSRSRVPMGGGANSDLRSVTMDVDDDTRSRQEEEQELYETTEPLVENQRLKRMRHAERKITTQDMFAYAGAQENDVDIDHNAAFEAAKTATLQSWEDKAKVNHTNPAVNMVRMTASYANMAPAKLMKSEFQFDRARSKFKRRGQYASCDKSQVVETGDDNIRQKFIRSTIVKTSAIMHTFLKERWSLYCLNGTIHGDGENIFLSDGNAIYILRAENGEEYPFFTTVVGQPFRFFEQLNLDMLETYCLFSFTGKLPLEGRCLLYFFATLTYQDKLWFDNWSEPVLFTMMNVILDSWMNLLIPAITIIQEAGCDNTDRIATSACLMLLECHKGRSDSAKNIFRYIAGKVRPPEVLPTSTEIIETLLGDNRKWFSNRSSLSEVAVQIMKILTYVKTIIESNEGVNSAMFQPKPVIELILDFIINGCKRIIQKYGSVSVLEGTILSKEAALQRLRSLETPLTMRGQYLADSNPVNPLNQFQLRDIRDILIDIASFYNACTKLSIGEFGLFDVEVSYKVLTIFDDLLDGLNKVANYVLTDPDKEGFNSTINIIKTFRAEASYSYEPETTEMTKTFQNLRQAMNTLNFPPFMDKIYNTGNTRYSAAFDSVPISQDVRRYIREISEISTRGFDSNTIILALQYRNKATRRQLQDALPAEARLDLIVNMGFSEDALNTAIRNIVTAFDQSVPNGMINTLLDEVNRRMHPTYVTQLQNIVGNESFSMHGSDFVRLSNPTDGYSRQMRARAIAIGQCLTSSAHKLFTFSNMESLKVQVEAALEQHYRKVLEMAHPEDVILNDYSLVEADAIYTTHFQEVLMMLRETLRRKSETVESFTDDMLRNIIYNSNESVRVVIARQTACRINLSSDLHPSRFFLQVRYPRLRAESTLLLRMMGRMNLKTTGQQQAYTLELSRCSAETDSPFRY